MPLLIPLQYGNTDATFLDARKEALDAYLSALTESVIACNVQRDTIVFKLICDHATSNLSTD
jgi:hypothetical protein